MNQHGINPYPKRRKQNQEQPYRPLEPFQFIESPSASPQPAPPTVKSGGNRDTTALDSLFHRFINKQEEETSNGPFGKDNKAGLERLFGNLDVLKQEHQTVQIQSSSARNLSSITQDQQNMEDDDLAKLLGGLSTVPAPRQTSSSVQPVNDKAAKLLSMLNPPSIAPAPTQIPPPHQASLLAMLSPKQTPLQPTHPSTSHTDQPLQQPGRPISLPTSPRPDVTPAPLSPNTSGGITPEERSRRQRALLEQITAGFGVDFPSVSRPADQGQYSKTHTDLSGASYNTQGLHGQPFGVMQRARDSTDISPITGAPPPYEHPHSSGPHEHSPYADGRQLHGSVDQTGGNAPFISGQLPTQGSHAGWRVAELSHPGSLSNASIGISQDGYAHPTQVSEQQNNLLDMLKKQPLKSNPPIPYPGGIPPSQLPAIRPMGHGGLPPTISTGPTGPLQGYRPVQGVPPPNHNPYPQFNGMNHPPGAGPNQIYYQLPPRPPAQFSSAPGQYSLNPLSGQNMPLHQSGPAGQLGQLGHLGQVAQHGLGQHGVGQHGQMGQIGQHGQIPVILNHPSPMGPSNHGYGHQQGSVHPNLGQNRDQTQGPQGQIQGQGQGQGQGHGQGGHGQGQGQNQGVTAPSHPGRPDQRSLPPPSNLTGYHHPIPRPPNSQVGSLLSVLNGRDV